MKEEKKETVRERERGKISVSLMFAYSVVLELMFEEILD